MGSGRNHVHLPPRPRAGGDLLLHGESDLLVREIDLLRATVQATRARHPFHIDAWVVLPEHMHGIWTLPAGNRDFARRWEIDYLHDSPVKHGHAARMAE